MPVASVYENGGIIGQTLDLGSTERYISGTSTPSYVGGASASGSSTLSLTGITGLQEGDLVLFWATEDTAQNGSFFVTDSWTTAVVNNNNSITNLVAYKVMGSTVDTSVSIYEETGAGNQEPSTLFTCDAMTATAWRGVEWGQVGGFVTGSGTTIDAGSVNVAANNSVVIVLGAIDDDNSTISSPPTGYTTAVENGRLGGSNAQMYKTGVSAGTEDPSSYTWSSTDALVSRTVVLKPTVTFGNLKNSGIWNLNAVTELLSRKEFNISFGNRVAATSGGSITVPLPSNIEAGDLLIAMGSCGTQLGSLGTPSGWTVDNVSTNTFVIRKVATGSDTAPVITKDTSGVDHAAVMYLIKKKNVSVTFESHTGAFDADGSISETAPSGTGSYGDLYFYYTFVGGPRTETTAVSNMTSIGGSSSTPAHKFYYAFDIGGETITNVWSSSISWRLARYRLD